MIEEISKIGLRADDVEYLSTAHGASAAAPVELVRAVEAGAHVSAPVQHAVDLHFAAEAASSPVAGASFH